MNIAVATAKRISRSHDFTSEKRLEPEAAGSVRSGGIGTSGGEANRCSIKVLGCRSSSTQQSKVTEESSKLNRFVSRIGDSDSGARALERCRRIPKTNLEDPKDLKEPRVKGALAAPEAIPQLRCGIHSWRGHRGQAHMGDGCDRETWGSHRTLQAPGQLLLRACPRRLRQEWQPKPVSDVPSIALLSNPRIFVVLEVFEVPKVFA